MPLPITTFTTIQQLLNYINTYIIPNGIREIEGEEHNAVENALANFIITYTLNSGLAGISSSTGIIPLSKPITVFTATPTSINWPDNVQNEYYIINATGNDIPLTAGYSYIDQYATVQTVVPARSSIHIVKATNGSWVQANNLPGIGVLPPQAGHSGEVLYTNGTSAAWGSLIIPITQDNFEADGVTYLNPLLQSFKFSVFWNEINRFIYNSDERPSQIEWQYEAAGGLQVLMPGFDANSNDYNLYIYLRGLNAPI